MDRPLPTKEEIIRIANDEARTLEDANMLVDYLMHHLGVQGAVVVQMREDLEFIKGVLVGEAKTKLATKLVGFDTPKLKVN